MAYGQVNYSENLGNGPYPISATGCFLTAFCNMLEDYGTQIDPPTLNNEFNSKGLFLASPEDGAGTRDDLAWGSISGYDPTLHVTATGGAGWPPAGSRAIVEFHYNSVHTGEPINHFCYTNNPQEQIIIDSYDGITKGPVSYQSVYGEPIAWATYDKAVTQTITPVVTPEAAPVVVVSTPPAAPVPFPGQGNPYTVVVPLKGYLNATAAGSQEDPPVEVPEGEYYIYRYYNSTSSNLINITPTKNVAGWWINNDFNKLPTVPVVDSTTPYVGPRESSAPVPTPTVVADTSWKGTYHPFNANGKPVKYVLLHDYNVQDYGGTGPTRLIKQYTEVPIYGPFGKDGVIYGRLKLAADTTWACYYGIPLTKSDGTDAEIVELEQAVYDPTTDVTTRKATKSLTAHDYEILAVDKIESIIKTIDGVFRRKKK